MRNRGVSELAFYVTFEENSSSANCPIEFMVTTFDLTGIGGSSNESFGDGVALALRVSLLTGNTWTWLSSSCRLKSTDASASMTIPITVTYFALITGHSPVCPIDFSSTVFDMTLYGGTTSNTFVDGVALALFISTYTGHTWNYDVTCKLSSSDSGSDLPDIVALSTYEILFQDINGEPMPCPFDFIITTFNMTSYGGTSTDVFVDGVALASAVSLHTGETWVFNNSTCILESNDAISNGILIVATITQTIIITGAPCLLDFANTTFDMSAYGGTISDSFIDSSALRLAVNTATGATWDYDSVNCKLTSVNAPSGGSIAALTTYVIDLFDVNGGGVVCPPDFTASTFDMSAYGGTATDVFSDGNALATAVSISTGFIWTYDNVNCVLKSINSSPNDEPNIIVTTTYEILIDDINGGLVTCPIDFSVTTFNMTNFGGSSTDSFSDGLALAAAVSAFETFTWVYDVVNCKLTSTRISNNGPIIATSTYLIEIEDIGSGGDIACPIDFVNTTFDMTSYGGTSSDIFSDGNAVASAVSANTGDTWLFDLVECRLYSIDAAANGVTILGQVTYLLLITGTSCPIDFTNTVFDMTLYGGTSTDSFSDGAALGNALTSFTGDTWTYDSVNCRLTSIDAAVNATSISATILTEKTITITGVTCPLDFSSITFDMSSYGGTTSDSFADSAAMKSALDSNTGFTWTYNSGPCTFTTSDIGAINDSIVATVSAFAPDDISGIFLWLDGTDINADGLGYTGAVDAWVDKITGTYSVDQATAADKPSTTTENGEIALSFDGDDYLRGVALSEFSSANDFTISLTVNPTVNEFGHTALMIGINTLNTFRIFADTRTTNIFTGTRTSNVAYYGSYSPKANPGLRHMLVTHDAFTNTIKGYLNGVLQHTVVYNGAWANPNFQIGSMYPNYNNLTGNYCEVVCYNSVLSASDQTDLDDYLSSKWGI